MKFRDLFDENMEPNYKKILSIKEFSAMKKTIQDEKYHSEGDVFEHTKLVVSEMIKCLDSLCYKKNSEEYLLLMTAALCHDIGKPTTTFFDEEKGDVAVKYHGLEGSNICRRLFYDENIILREKLCYMVKNHMSMHYMFRNGKLIRTIIKLSHGLVTVQEMAMLYMCDVKGRVGELDEKSIRDNIDSLIKMATDIKCYKTKYNFDNFSQKNEFFYQLPDDLKYNKGKKFTVYFMIGLPGAGKGTYISKKLHNIPIITMDRIKSEIPSNGGKRRFAKSEEDFITKKVNDEIKNNCENRLSFVINNTNLRKENRDVLEKIILPYKPRIVFVYVEAPTIADNKNRTAGNVSPNVIDKMAKSIDFPEPYEYDEIRYDVQRTSNND